MNNSSIPEAAESAASVAAFPITAFASAQAPVAQDRSIVPASDLPDSSADALPPTRVTATAVAPANEPALPAPALPLSPGLHERQRIALRALASGQSTETAAQLAGVNPVTVYRWKRHHPRFIAALNAWKAESLSSAGEVLIAAVGCAARNVLRAAQAGDMRASLTLLKGLGALDVPKVGPQFSRAVETDLAGEDDRARRRAGRLTAAMRENFNNMKRVRQEDEAKAKREDEEAARRNRKLYFDAHAKIPPLPRPITREAVEQSVKANARICVTYPQRCSLTITAVAGDLKPLAAAIAEYDAIAPDLAESRLKALPNLLESVILWDHAEAFAGKLESLGATVELRPGWRT